MIRSCRALWLAMFVLLQCACAPPSRQLTLAELAQRNATERREAAELEKAVRAHRFGAHARVQQVAGRIAVIASLDNRYFREENIQFHSWKIWRDVFTKNNPAAERPDCVSVMFVDHLADTAVSGIRAPSDCPRL